MWSYAVDGAITLKSPKNSLSLTQVIICGWWGYDIKITQELSLSISLSSDHVADGTKTLESFKNSLALDMHVCAHITLQFLGVGVGWGVVTHIDEYPLIHVYVHKYNWPYLSVALYKVSIAAVHGCT